ncbi:MAG: helix-turn-helix domain-containing protein [Janthinobacterium lividum]
MSLEALLALPFHDAIALLEKALLENALHRSGENKSEAARRLGIHRRLLYEKLQQYQLS